jgi:maleate isomerase
MAEADSGGGRETQINSAVSVAVETARPVVGLLALGEDRVVAGEIGAFFANGNIEVLSTRVGMPSTLTLEGFRSMGEAFRRGAASLSGRCSLVAVACASAAVAIGPARLSEIVEGGLPGTEAVEPITAYLESLTERSAKRIALVTPYAPDTHRALAGLLQARGIAVATGFRLRVPAGHVPSDVAPASIYEAVSRAELGNVDCLVISCTALSTASLLDDLEAYLGIPVVTTNRALAESITRRLVH